MPDAGVGDRSGWKDRIEQSTWVDGARWVDDEEEAPVEFLEAEPSAYRLSEASNEDKVSLARSPIARILGIGAVAVVLIALAIMSRPGDQDPFSQLPAADQQQLLERQAQAEALLDEQTAQAENAESESDDGAATGSDDESSDADEEGAPTATAADGDLPGTPTPIPELRARLPQNLPGVLFSYGPQDSVVSIKRSEPQPEEILLEPGLVGGPSGMIRTSDSEVSVFVGDQLYSLPAAGGVQSSALPDGELHPAEPGFLVVLTQDRVRNAFILGAPSVPSEQTDAIVIGNDLEVLGGWGDRALVHQASKVWLLDKGGRSQLVTDGVVIGYNDGYLAMVRCDGPGTCRIEVGPPDQPSRRSVAVPENLAGRDLDLWAGTGAVSADGDRLAVIDQRGPVRLPTWIDLETGADSAGSDTVLSGSAVVWSPDGLWLAYALDGAVLVWDTEADQLWTISLGRPISHLAWLAEAESASEAEDDGETEPESDGEPDA